MTASTKTNGPVNVPLGKFPATRPLNLLAADADAVAQNDNATLSSKDSYWRDHLCLAWVLYTAKGHDSVAHFLDRNRPPALHVETDWSSDSDRALPWMGSGTLAAFSPLPRSSLNLAENVGSCGSRTRMEKWKNLTLFTSLLELNGHEERLNGRRSAGRGVLTAAARLKMLNVDTLLDVWTRATVKSPSWDGEQWTVVLARRNPEGTVSTRTVHPRHIIQATGHSGEKYIPPIAAIDSFKGDGICHSPVFTGALHESRRNKAVVISSYNSGHDTAHDFYELRYGVAVAQRGTTCANFSEAITDIGLKGLYDGQGPPTEDAVVLRVNNGPNGAGLMIQHFQPGGSYYIDVRAGQPIIDGHIKIQQGVEISEVQPRGLRFAHGTELWADAIILATGSKTRCLLGDETADAVGGVWGFDSNSEKRGICRPSGHKGSYYSRILALQIKAAEAYNYLLSAVS
ncbi:hypothetical protein BDV10DRAFT_193338 [Aspergillus recurvatus]